MTEPIISSQDLTKTYGSRWIPIKAVCGIGLEVHCGEIFGLVGPDGS